MTKIIIVDRCLDCPFCIEKQEQPFCNKMDQFLAYSEVEKISTDCPLDEAPDTCPACESKGRKSHPTQKHA